ncbi:hypothetical protein ACHAPT_001879 [Fusarium lateritium]
MAFSWRNPIGDLGPIPPHPATESELSSAISNFSSFAEASEEYERLLDLFHYSSPEDQASTVGLLRTFHKFLPNEGKEALVNDVIAIGRDDNKLRALVNHIREAVLKPLKVAGGQQPQTPVTPPYRPHAAAEIALAMTQIESSTRDGQANLKCACLRRDGYRCVWTEKFDRKSVEKGKVVDLPVGTRVVHTECAHVLPFALSKFDSKNAVETENKATIWWALYRYFPGLKDKIGPETMNQERNAITLGCDVHEDFGQYKLAFWPTGKENKYKAEWFTPWPGAQRAPGTTDLIMELKSSDPSVPMPSPEYFKVHHRIAQILEVSGIGHAVEEELDAATFDPENMSPDGSTDIASIIRRKMLMDI